MSLKICNVLLSNVWGAVGPAALERGIGGREGAMIYLSKAWAAAGNQVTNFVDVEQGERFYEGDGYHEYVPLNLCRPMLANFPWHVGIAWETPSSFEDHRILENIKLKICEMQVCHFSAREQEAAEGLCDYVAVLSDWHGQFLINSGLEMEDDDEVITFPNGVDISRYPEEKIQYGFNGKPIKFVYSSSPDRGLWHLLKIWPKIRKDFPEAELLVGYGVEKWVDFNKWSHGRAGEMAVEIQRLMKQKGVKDIGKIGQGKLAELQLEATAWLYPLDSMNATESGAISAIENAAAGNPIITSDADCMPSEFGSIGRIVPLPFIEDNYYNAVKSVLTDEDYYVNLQKRGRKFAEGRDWNIIAKSWEDFFLTKT